MKMSPTKDNEVAATITTDGASVLKKLKHWAKSSQSAIIIAKKGENYCSAEKNIELVKDVVEIKSVFQPVIKVKHINSRYDVQWIVDKSVKGCMVCDHRFSLFVRRHHCRYFLFASIVII